TFHGPVEIPLATNGVADEVAVFHGGNGTGKSNALAALDMFFRASVEWLSIRPQLGSDDLTLLWNKREDYSGLVPSSRDWPPGVLDPLRIDVQFAEAKTPFSITLMPAGNRVILSMGGVWAPGGQPVGSRPQVLNETDKNYLSPIINQLQIPLGPSSKPFFR